MNKNSFEGILKAVKEYISENEPYVCVECNGEGFCDVYISEDEDGFSIDVTAETQIYIEEDKISFWADSPILKNQVKLDSDLIIEKTIEDDVIFIKTQKGFYVNVYLD